MIKEIPMQSFIEQSKSFFIIMVSLLQIRSMTKSTVCLQALTLWVLKPDLMHPSQTLLFLGVYAESVYPTLQYRTYLTICQTKILIQLQFHGDIRRRKKKGTTIIPCCEVYIYILSMNYKHVIMHFSMQSCKYF